MKWIASGLLAASAAAIAVACAPNVELGIEGCSCSSTSSASGGMGTGANGGTDGGSPACDAAVTYASGPTELLSPSPTPEYCAAPLGVAVSGAPERVSAAMVGAWTRCGDGAFPEVQFTADGHFAFLVRGAIADPWQLTPSTDPTKSGTYTVVDASGTLGAGTYQAKLTYASGSVETPQIMAYGSPPRLRLFDGLNAGEPSDLVPAPTSAYRQGVCGSAAGPAMSYADDAALRAAMVGRWASCSGPGTYVGYEFLADGSWFALTEDDTGHLVRATNNEEWGFFTVDSSSLTLFSGTPDGGLVADGAIPYDAATANNRESFGQPTVSECPRSLTMVVLSTPPQTETLWPLP